MPPELDAETKARIEAEEAYRARVRSEHAAGVEAAPRRRSDLPLILGIAFAVLIASGVMYQLAPPGMSTVQRQQYSFGNFGAACQRLVREHLKAPTTAVFSNYYTDQDEGRAGGTFPTGFHWTGSVSSQNTFGGMVRASFACSTPAGSDAVQLDALN